MFRALASQCNKALSSSAVLASGTVPAVSSKLGAVSAVRQFSAMTAELEEEWHDRLEQCRNEGEGKKKKNRLSARARISKILDPGTPYLEIGRQCGLDLRYGDVPCAGVVAGVGVVSGVLCIVSANDATVKGGTTFPISLKKQLRMQEIAAKCRMPVVYVVDSGGAYLPEQANIFNEGGKSFYNQANMQAAGIPQVSLICGSCTAGAAYAGVMSGHVIIVEGIGSLYLAGPPLVKAATGEDVTAEELGGADLHCRVSGSIDYLCKTEEEGINTTRNIVGLYSDLYPAPSGWSSDTDVTDIAPGSDMRQIVEDISDPGTLMEFKQLYGEGIATTWGKIGGMKVGFVSGSGVLDAQSALKASHFVQICEQAQIPLIFIQGDQTSDSMRELCSLTRSVATTTVPRITLLTGATRGQAYIAMSGAGLKPDFMFTWPSATIGSCDEDDDEPMLDAWECADELISDDIILPSETRSVLKLALLAASSKGRHTAVHCNPVLKF